MRAIALLTLLLAALVLLAPARPAAHAVPRATLTPEPPTPTAQRAGSEPPVWPTEVDAYPAPLPATPLDLCGYIGDNGAPWWSEDGHGNPRPCPGPPPATPTPEPALRARQWLPIVGR